MSVPQVRLKAGVVLHPLTPALIRLLAVTDQAVRVLGRDLRVTCGREGHSVTDPHTRGEALDLGTRELPEGTILTLVQWLRTTLGPAWTVLYEVKEKPNGVLASIAYINPDASAQHIHIQPRKGTSWPPSPLVNA